MGWDEVSVGVMRPDTAAAESALERLGALAVTLQDDADHPVLEPGPGETPLWPTVQVRGLFDAGVDRAAVLEGLAGVPGADRPGNLRWREVDDRDWARAWMDRFQPMRFGERLWIVPSGMDMPEDPASIAIRLDPGLAFGTGTHPTTALCLEWLDGQSLNGASVVDYGCGSGILAIAAALKGAVGVTCVDNDPQALEATAQNAARNDVGERLRCCLPGQCPDRAVSLVLANILAGPLVELAPTLLGMLEAGGDLVLSGILSEQADWVLAAYQEGLTRTTVTEHDGWVRVHGVKR